MATHSKKALSLYKKFTSSLALSRAQEIRLSLCDRKIFPSLSPMKSRGVTPLSQPRIFTSHLALRGAQEIRLSLSALEIYLLLSHRSPGDTALSELWKSTSCLASDKSGGVTPLSQPRIFTSHLALRRAEEIRLSLSSGNLPLA